MFSAIVEILQFPVPSFRTLFTAKLITDTLLSLIHTMFSPVRCSTVGAGALVVFWVWVVDFWAVVLGVVVFWVTAVVAALVVLGCCVKGLVFDCFCVVSVVEFVLGLIGSNKLQKTTINIIHAGIRNARVCLKTYSLCTI